MDAMTAFERVEIADKPLFAHIAALADFLAKAASPVSVGVTHKAADLALLSLLCLAYPKVPSGVRPSIRLIGKTSCLSAALLDYASAQGWGFEVGGTRSSHLLLSECQGDASGRACGDEGLHYWHVPRRVGFAPLRDWTSSEIGAFLCGGDRRSSGVKGQPDHLAPCLPTPYLTPWGQDVRSLLAPPSSLHVVRPVHTE